MANQIGDKILGASFPSHPVYGPRRDVTVLQVSPTTLRWTLGEIVCPCGNTRQIHPGDAFQVTLCVACKEAERAAKKPANPEREARQTQRAEARAVKSQARRAAQAQKSEERKIRQAAKLQARADALQAKHALIAKTAQEHGVQVSVRAAA